MTRTIDDLQNLGPPSVEMPAREGVVSAKQLKARGAVAAFVTVKRAGGKSSLNVLWALEGALTNRDWKEVAKQERMSLLMRLDIHGKGRRRTRRAERSFAAPETAR